MLSAAERRRERGRRKNAVFKHLRESPDNLCKKYVFHFSLVRVLKFNIRPCVNSISGALHMMRQPQSANHCHMTVAETLVSPMNWLGGHNHMAPVWHTTIHYAYQQHAIAEHGHWACLPRTIIQAKLQWEGLKCNCVHNTYPDAVMSTCLLMQRRSAVKQRWSGATHRLTKIKLLLC